MNFAINAIDYDVVAVIDLIGETETRHAGLFDLFLEVRNASAAILDHTSLSDLVTRNRRILARRARGGK